MIYYEEHNGFYKKSYKAELTKSIHIIDNLYANHYNVGAKQIWGFEYDVDVNTQYLLDFMVEN